jgi:hypothetical protein
MAGLLSHALGAIAFAALLGWVVGLPPISFGIFMAGVITMFMEQDYDELSATKRTPITHSVFFGIIWVVILSIFFLGLAPLKILSGRISQELVIAVISAFTTHLLIDAFTKEGIYIIPKGTDMRRWIRGLPRGETETWAYWKQFRIEKILGRKISRANDDPILNACISLPSLIIIIIFVAAMPLPT